MHLTTLGDPVRIQQFALLCGTAPPFRGHDVVEDENGKAWACARLNGHLFAVPLARLESGLRFGQVAERVLWAVHCRARSQPTGHIAFTKEELRNAVWGTKQRPHWSSTLMRTLASFADLRMGDQSTTAAGPQLEESQPLFTRINAANNQIVFVLGEGFLGSLEQFVVRKVGQTTYEFPSGKRLKKLRDQQRVQDIYLPVYLGDFAACGRFSARQKRLLQAIVNEVTCPARAREEGAPKPVARSLENAEVITNARIAKYGGRGFAECPLLEPLMNYVGFNGNGVRRGQGYKLCTWAAKAGYSEDELNEFLNDLALVAEELGLEAVAIGKSQLRSLAQLRRQLSYGVQPRHRLDNFHVRIYARADFIERWSRIFQWPPAAESSGELTARNPAILLDGLRDIMHAERISQKQLAEDFQVTKQFLSAVLRGKKRCPDKLAKRIAEFISEGHRNDAPTSDSPIEPPKFSLVTVPVKQGSSTMRKAALAYYDRGWSVIPIRSWEYPRKPFIKWTKYQDQRPSRQKVIDWWTQWPDAGIAVVLGRVSGLLCADVDGELPYRILMDLVGNLPETPTSKSGGKDPFRFHMFFQHPTTKSGARRTPWSKPDDKEKLELRGHGGLTVLPPSLHKSGRRYAWVKGRNIKDLDLLELPDVLLEGLESAMATPQHNDESTETSPSLATAEAAVCTSFDGYEVAPSTARFLSGLHAESAGWNERLFRAGCDLHGRGVPQTKAEILLLAGAKPRTSKDQRSAQDTIASAYSQPRAPSLY